MLFYFIRYVIFFPFSKEIPDQNNFTNKIHGYFVMFDWDFYFKIIYNDIDQILKSLRASAIDFYQTLHFMLKTRMNREFLKRGASESADEL